ncbi:hypothetical protein F5I97DRAFT_812801 [Phlebopus sp. FC_14]|nr:hypothetical protein F5I97DRAFT_812801 [Phlebopus sp. FC_14]
MSSSQDIAVPPMNEISLVGIWMETVIYGEPDINIPLGAVSARAGFNCVVYGLCMYVLLRKQRGAGSIWMLTTTSTVLFVLCTAHVAASLRQLLEAFIYVPPSAPSNYSTLYWLDETLPMTVVKNFLYDCLVFLQDIVLIWRLYIVWCRNWKIIVFPVLVEATHMACAYAGTVLLARPGASLYNSVLSRLGMTGWSLDIALNISVTLAIAGRLWWMGQRVSSISSTVELPNRYAATIYTIIESGGLFAAVTIVMLALYVRGSPLALTGIDIASQLAVLTPLLIVVRVGLGLTHGLPRAYEEYHSTAIKSTQVRPKFRVPTSHEVELDNISARSQAFVGNYKEV